MTYIPPKPPDGMPADIWEECMKIGEIELGLTFIYEAVNSKTTKNENCSKKVGIAKAKDVSSDP